MLPMSCTGETKPAQVPEFGAACDGDADRNMILGATCWQYNTLPVLSPLHRTDVIQTRYRTLQSHPECATDLVTPMQARASL